MDMSPALSSAAPARSKTVPPAAPGRGHIQSIERAVAILEVVANRPDGITLAEVSTALGLHSSTAFHLIRTLVSLGIVEQLESKRYHVGSRLFMLAASSMTENAMLTQATPILEALSRDTGNAAHLAIRSRHEIVVIARTAATGLLQLSGGTGTTRPAHCTAIGKMLFSEVPQETLGDLLDQLDFHRFTSHTITDRRRLLSELATIRATGVAHDNCELDEDIKCVATSVRDFASRCVAAIGISGPIWRMGPAAMKKKTAILRESAGELSRRLGFQGEARQT
jgi:IclR family acetate operon transcriptional repressor